MLKIKNNKLRKGIEISLVSFLVLTVCGFLYVLFLIVTSENPVLQSIISKEVSIVLDEDGNDIVMLERKIDNQVGFNDLPDVFVNALISVEDVRFFEHFGVDLPRVIASLSNNLINPDKIQGASTLTQQLIKNVFLDSDKKLERKIREAYMAIEMENTLSKEEIIEAYANRIMFDGVNIGVNSASLKYFLKPINEVNLAEAAFLAGMVNAPSYYNPVRNPANAQQRKNLVLELMYENGYINEFQKEQARSMTVSEMIRQGEYQEQTYPYQSYLDVVYKEVKQLTGLNPYTTPMVIETHMDKQVQKLIDNIQNNEDSKIHFSDDNQQITVALIDNKSGALVGVSGGRFYEGQLLFNRASDMKKQPASIMKPILSYALAIEHLGWSNNHVVVDSPYTYKGTSKSVKNVDNRYMGDIFLSEALGYSRNTSALKTLDEVIDKIGVRAVTSYLSEINLLDVEPEKFNITYGLGAHEQGVSPNHQAGAYSILARGGLYIEPYTVKKITLLDGSNRVYTPSREEKRVLKEETAFLVSEVLKEIVTKNYWNMGTVAIDNIDIHVKTGTSSFDNSALIKYNYPSTASKDIWYAGYSPDYTNVIWSGFDESKKGDKNYFSAGTDSRKGIPKQLFSRIMEFQARQEDKIKVPETLTKVNIVKGSYPYLLPDSNTPSSMIISSYFKKGEEPTTVVSPPAIKDLDNLDILLIDNQMEINFPNKLASISDPKQGRTIFSYENIYRKIINVLEITSIFEEEVVYRGSENTFTIPINQMNAYTIKAYRCYENHPTIRSNVIEKSIFYSS